MSDKHTTQLRLIATVEDMLPDAKQVLSVDEEQRRTAVARLRLAMESLEQQVRDIQRFNNSTNNAARQ